mmetsp:Transcript_25065/g.53016  ORF Transcript_25065/g.53016 Transcript_25065/m.53016 type:complete len:196 (+) Transcript_25065:185-772(+)|eukprot:CAMPEP_0183703724 /NCGR_PEP_ID=MMETSP0737-20130205/1362_1 /TAXON_ID=385413 /ORGANISM="Thalassiosira miniscula, Strain CCMP1093" /LENGTH=195 /DNA_ID=CAMNT_0025930521 /DNA_START=185 /DNA_END=772 /DNA_ORIENTATION=+
MSDTEEAKQETTNEPITIRVKDQTGEETMFKIKKSTKMSKVFTAYAARKGVEVASLRFLLDGERIGPDETPKMLELEDEDQIDCVLAQVGGMSDEADGGADGGGGGGGGEVKPENTPITIRVKDQNGEETMFKIKKTTKMKKVFSTYAARKGVEANAMRFMLDGENIDPEATPASLDLDDDDQIDCFLAQVGGSC